MRQRVVLALALCAEPDLLIADEPTTALDVSIQAQIIALLKRLCRERGTAVMLITHDMGVIAETADRVAVMYAGRIAEIGPVRDVVQQPAPPLHQGPDGRDPDGRRHARRGWCRSPAPCRGSAPSPRAAPSTRAARRPSTRCRVERPERDAGRTIARPPAGSSPKPPQGPAHDGGDRHAAGRGEGPHARVRRLQALAQPRHRGRAARPTSRP